MPNPHRKESHGSRSKRDPDGPSQSRRPSPHHVHIILPRGKTKKKGRRIYLLAVSSVPNRQCIRRVCTYGTGRPSRIVGTNFALTECIMTSNLIVRHPFRKPLALLLLLLITTFSKLVFGAAGELDSTFGHGGIALQAFNGTFTPARVALQANGKLLVVGQEYINSGGSYFEVARFNQDGSLDEKFGSGGFVKESFSGRYGRDAATAVALDSRGKIIVTGYINGSVSVAGSENGNSGGTVVRYNANGSRDRTFGRNGQFILNTNTPDGECGFHDILLLPDGRIMAVGSLNFSMLILMLKQNGTLDTTFGESGMVTVRRRSSSNGNSVALDELGRIVVGGATEFGGYSGRDSADFLIVRLRSNGTLDSTFGKNGEILFDFGQRDFVARIATLPGNSILAVGSIYDEDEGAVVKFLADGRRHPQFGKNGVVEIGNYLSDFIPSDMVIQPDGKILVCGSGPVRTTIFRYLRDGNLDGSFDDDGIRSLGFGQQKSYGATCAMTSDNKLIVVGSIRLGRSLGLARILLK